MAFAAGQHLTAQLLNSALGESKDDTQVTSGTTTSTTFTATLTGGTTSATTFVAPTSGKVLIHNTSQATNSGTGSSICSFEVRTGGTIGGGSVFRAATDDDFTGIGGSTNTRSTAVSPISGLTPGSTYHVRQMFRASSGTGTFLRKNVIVEPKV